MPRPMVNWKKMDATRKIAGVNQGFTGDGVANLFLVVVQPDERPALGDEPDLFEAHRDAVDERVGEEDDHICQSGQDEGELATLVCGASAANAWPSGGGRVGLAGGCRRGIRAPNRPAKVPGRASAGASSAPAVGPHRPRCLSLSGEWLFARQLPVHLSSAKKG